MFFLITKTRIETSCMPMKLLISLFSELNYFKEIIDNIQCRTEEEEGR